MLTTINMLYCIKILQCQKTKLKKVYIIGVERSHVKQEILKRNIANFFEVEFFYYAILTTD